MKQLEYDYNEIINYWLKLANSFDFVIFTDNEKEDDKKLKDVNNWNYISMNFLDMYITNLKTMEQYQTVNHKVDQSQREWKDLNKKVKDTLKQLYLKQLNK